MLTQPRPLIPFTFERQIVQAIQYILLDTFGSGSLANSNNQNRTSDIGFLRYSNGSGVQSISGGALVSNGTPSTNDGFNSGTGSALLLHARTAGRVFRMRIFDRTTMGTGARFGCAQDASANTLDMGVRYSAADTLVARRASGDGNDWNPGADDHAIACVMRSAGGRLIIRNGTDTPKLVWIYQTDTADESIKFRPGTNANDLKTDDWKVFDYPALADDWVDATLHQTPAASGDTFTATADALHTLAFTLPGSPSASMGAVSLFYRLQDANNYWVCYIQRNSGNTAWTMKIDRVVAGVVTNLFNNANVGTPDRLMVYVEGTTHKGFTESSGNPASRGSGTFSHADSATGMLVTYHANTTIGELTSWALTNALYDGLFTA